MPGVSVIVPTYNYARFLDPCLESIFAQTYGDFEVIVVDDGSTDDTVEVLRKYEDRIRYIYQENMGLSAARNTGIKVSTGKYLAFLDSDDIWLPLKLEAQLRVISEDSDVGIVFSDARAFDGKNVLRESILKEERICTGHCFRRLFMGNFLVMPTVMIRKKCLDEVGLFDETLTAVEDYDLWLRISAHYKIGYVDMMLAMYRVHPSNMSRDYCRLLDNEIRVIRKIVELFPERARDLGGRVHRRFNSLYTQYGLELVRKGDVGQAMRSFMNAIIEQPWRVRPYYYFMAAMTGKRGFDALREFKRSWLRLNQ
ncbi:MAG: glycosyltransferase [Acidobacteriota bacterium]